MSKHSAPPTCHGLLRAGLLRSLALFAVLLVLFALIRSYFEIFAPLLLLVLVSASYSAYQCLFPHRSPLGECVVNQAALQDPGELHAQFQEIDRDMAQNGVLCGDVWVGEAWLLHATGAVRLENLAAVFLRLSGGRHKKHRILIACRSAEEVELRTGENSYRALCRHLPTAVQGDNPRAYNKYRKLTSRQREQLIERFSQRETWDNPADIQWWQWEDYLYI